MQTSDVVVVGAGNAGFCAAIAAAQQGARVTLLEAAPEDQWGGNTALTMNFRFPHTAFDELLGFVAPSARDQAAAVRSCYQPYAPEAYLDDLQRVSGGRADPVLARSLAFGAAGDAIWLRSLGHRWVLRDPANIVPGAMPIRIDGGGSALQQRHRAAAAALGVDIRFGTSLVALEKDGDLYRLGAQCPRGSQRFDANSVILACGGFEANAEMRAEHLGEEWRHVALRGVPTNRGDGLRLARALGADIAGDWSNCHATPQDANLPAFMLPSQQADSQANARYAFNIGITVNRHGRRFIDEGWDFPNLIYARMGRAILAQPEAIAWQLFDHHLVGMLPDGYFAAGTLLSSDSLAALAVQAGIDPAGLEATVAAFNATAHGSVRYDRRDGRGTHGLMPGKSNWALRLAQPPFYIAPVRTGITFTYGGLRVDGEGRVLDRDGQAIPGLFCCGEMAGGLFHGNYVGGSGLMFGSHLGRRAGMVVTKINPK